jgi:hypothetical protein
MGVEIRGEGTEQKKRSDFFGKVAERLNCWEIEQWFVRRPDIDLAHELRARRRGLARAV